MKLIIDINDNEYMGIKKYPDNITSYPVTIHIYDAVRKGIPLEQIRAEMDGIEINGQIDEHTSFIRSGNEIKKIALDIIDKYKGDKE